MYSCIPLLTHVTTPLWFWFYSTKDVGGVVSNQEILTAHKISPRLFCNLLLLVLVHMVLNCFFLNNHGFKIKLLKCVKMYDP